MGENIAQGLIRLVAIWNIYCCSW